VEASKSNHKRIELFVRANEFPSSSATTLAKTLLAISRVKMLRLIERQLALYRKRAGVNWSILFLNPTSRAHERHFTKRLGESCFYSL
jgi:hypothetical protein